MQAFEHITRAWLCEVGEKDPKPCRCFGSQEGWNRCGTEPNPLRMILFEDTDPHKIEPIATHPLIEFGALKLLTRNVLDAFGCEKCGREMHLLRNRYFCQYCITKIVADDVVLERVRLSLEHDWRHFEYAAVVTAVFHLRRHRTRKRISELMP